MRQIIDAFNYLHQKKVIHNNININNILINYEDEKDEKEMNLLKSNVKIIDFKFGSKFNNMLKANVFIYTKNKNQPSFKNDNFNLGKLCYKMLFGKYAINDNIDDNSNIDNMEKIIEEIEEGKSNYSITLYKEIISFLKDLFRMNHKILKIDELSEHEFLTKNLKDFQLINEQKDKKDKKNEQNEKDEKEMKKHLCIICLANNQEIILSPCGHKCICENCYYKLIYKNQISNCPVCRNPIKSIVSKIFEI